MATTPVTPTPVPAPAPTTAAAQAHFNLGLLLQILASLAPIVAAAVSPFLPAKVGTIIATEGTLVGEAGQVVNAVEGQQQ